MRQTLTGMMVYEEYRTFALPIMYGAVSGQTFARLLSCRVVSCVRYEPANSYIRDTATDGSNNKKRKPRVGEVNQVSRCGIRPGPMRETRARLGGLEPPRSHEGSLALWDWPAVTEVRKLLVKSLCHLGDYHEIPVRVCRPAGAGGLASLAPGLRAIHPMVASRTFA